VEDGVVGEPVVAGSHGDGGLDKRSLVVVVHRPAHHGLGVAIDDGRQVDPAFPGVDVRDVADQFQAGSIGGEVALDEVGDVVGLAVVVGEAEPPGPGLARLQAQLTHEAADELGSAPHVPAGQVGMDPAVAVGAVGVGERLDDEQLEFFAPAGGGRGRPVSPFVESGARHLQECAHLDDGQRGFGVRGVRGVGCVLYVDELELVAHR
jgi:hypothetical protein